MLAIMRGAVGRAPGVVRSLLHRKELFGRPWSELTQLVVRGPSPWSVGERETFAAFASRLDRCLVGTSAHSAVAEAAFGEGAIQPVLDDRRTAPIGEPLRATPGLVETYTPYPGTGSARLRFATRSTSRSASTPPIGWPARPGGRCRTRVTTRRPARSC